MRSNEVEIVKFQGKKMNFLGGKRGSKRFLSKNLLLKIVSKKCDLMLIVKYKSVVLSLFVGKMPS